ncbi:MAG: hypothetical protein NC036_03720 [Muribaculaceae bacterium]|nr:hypothetical protein [Muribaculaceae bacterium]
MNIIRILFCLILLFSTISSQANIIGGDWKKHPGADLGSGRTATHIAEQFRTERYSYFLAQGRAFAPDRGIIYMEGHSYGYYYLYPFRYDSLHPERGIYPLSDDLPLSGTRVDVMEYSPLSNTLVLVYKDGMIDIITDGKDVHPIRELKDYRTPGNKATFSCRFDLDGRRAYLATAFGYLTLDIQQGKCLEFNNLNHGIFEICRVGERMVVLTRAKTDDGIDPSNVYTYSGKLSSIYDGDLYFYTPGTTPDFTTTSYQKVKLAAKGDNTSTVLNTSTGQLRRPQRLMPLTENTFAVVPHYNDNKTGLFVVHIGDDNTCVGSYVVTGNTEFGISGTQYIHKSNYDKLVSSYRDGYTFSFTNGLALLRRGVDFNPESENPVADFRTEAVTFVEKTTTNFPEAAGNEIKMGMSTWDGHEFWTYHTKIGMANRVLTLEDDSSNKFPAPASWSAPTDVVKFNACSTSDPFFLQYHPDYGMIVRGRPGRGGNYLPGEASQYDALCAYRNGQWTDLSMSREGTPAAGSYPQPCGIGIDPLDSKYIYGGTFSHGMFRINTRDHSDVLAFTRSTDNSVINNVANTFTIFPIQQPYKSCTNASNPVFDTKGTLWTDLDNRNTNTLLLYYWTAEDRKAVMDASYDPAVYEAHPMKTLEVPGNDITSYGHLMPLKYPGHENILVYSCNNYFGEEYEPKIFDHNGTLNDPSDDRWIALHTPVIDGVQPLDKGFRTRGVFENLKTGQVWFMTELGILTIDVDNALKGDKSMHILRPECAITPQRSFEGTFTTCAATDSDGNIWVGTLSDGIYVLNPEATKIIGHYNTDNSPVPSDIISVVALDESTGSMFIGTQEGLIEFLPDGHNTVTAEGIKAIPYVVTPDYKGSIKITGLNDNKTYSIVDAKGQIIADLEKSQIGISEWQPINISTGAHYLISKENPKVRLLEIPVIK